MDLVEHNQDEVDITAVAPPEPTPVEGSFVDEGREARYERKQFYPAAHAVMRLIRRHQREFSADTREHPTLLQDQVDTMLLDVMALADEYITKPKNSTAFEQQRKRISEFELFSTKTGDDLADAFLGELQQEKMSRFEEQTDVSVDQDIEQSMTRLLAVPQVRDEFIRIFTDETQLRRSAKGAIAGVMILETAIDTARARYRQMQNEPRNTDPAGTALPTSLIQHNLARYLEIIQTLEKRVKTREARLGYKELGLLESSRLLKTRHQMREYGFALTESRQALFDRISELTSAGFKIFLGGPTGTGKTSLAVFAMREILGQENQFEVVSWSPETTVRDLFGKPIIKAAPDGRIESAMQKGPYARVLSGETRGIVSDEFTSGQTATQLSLKRIYQARPGEEINLPGFNGQVFTKERYLEISTGNLRSKQHQQREEMDAAIAREFVSIAVPFMDHDEASRILLSSFMHEAGFLPISKRDVEMIGQLCRAAEFTQKAFEGKFTMDERKQDTYRQIEPTGAEIHLTKTFFDSGTLFRLVSGVSGRSFAEHLRLNLAREINENPHLQALPKEQEAFRKILKAYGFSIDAADETSFYRSTLEVTGGTADANRPYILSSEMGFLSGVEKTSVDEFGDENERPPGATGKERRNQRRVRAMANPRIPDSVKAVLDQQEAAPVPEGSVSLAEAKAIFGTDCLGPDEIKKAFKLEGSITAPPIPFTKEELIRAQAAGQFLILRQPLSMKELAVDRLQGTVNDGTKILAAVVQGTGQLKDGTWFKDEQFFNEQRPGPRWALVSKELVPSSTSKSYLEQTDLIVETLKNQIFKDKPMPRLYQEAIDEFMTARAEIARLLSADSWREAAAQLEALKLTSLTRQSPAEMLYDLVAYFQTTGIRLLPNHYAWSARRRSAGDLVLVGNFDASGASVSRQSPGNPHDFIGLVLSLQSLGS